MGEMNKSEGGTGINYVISEKDLPTKSPLIDTMFAFITIEHCYVPIIIQIGLILFVLYSWVNYFIEIRKEVEVNILKVKEIVINAECTHKTPVSFQDRIKNYLKTIL